MKVSGRKLLSLGCVILLLPGFVSSCKKRTDTTQDPAVVSENQIRNMLDDFFAYFKIAKSEKICSLSEDPSSSEELLRDVTETSGNKPFETTCRRVVSEIVKVTASDEEGTAEVRITFSDPDKVTEKAAAEGGFADIGKLSEYIAAAPTVTKAVTLSLKRVDGSWKISEKSMTEVLDMIFGFLKESDLISDVPETTPAPKTLDISVFDAYWVDTKGKETGGYHISEEKVCLYVYTWNTYSNVTIKYEYIDSAGNLLYSNSFLMKSNTDWIACSWRPGTKLPEGDVYCRLYEPSGEEFHTSKVHIFPDDQKLPFPITWMDGSGWVDDNGLPVDFYTSDVTRIEYRGQSLKSYKDLSLKYRFVDEEGKILFEDTWKTGDLTENFIFSMELPEEYKKSTEETSETTMDTSGTTTESSTEPTEAPAPRTITLIVETTDGQPFLETKIEIRDSVIGGILPPLETEAPSETSAS